MALNNLEEFLETESQRILIDTSTMSTGDLDPKIDFLVKALSYGDMSVDTLKSLKEIWKSYISFLESDRIMVIPEVSEERLRYVKSFEGHYNLIGVKEARTTKRIKKTQKFHNVAYKMARRQKVEDFGDERYMSSKRKSRKRPVSEQETLYKEVIGYLKDMQSVLYSKHVIIQDPIYDELKESIIDLVREREIKSRSQPKGKYEYEDLHTNEILVATGIYLAVRDKEAVTIATSNGDIGKILIYANWLLRYTGDEGLDQLLKEHPVEVFFLPQFNAKSTKYTVTTNNSMRLQKSYNGIDAEKTERVITGLLQLSNLKQDIA